MRWVFSAVLMSLFAIGPAQAGQAEVRDVALANNCSPKKIEIYQENLGAMGEIVYRVQCTLPKAVGETSTSAPDTLMVSCVQSLCEMANALSLDKK